MQGSQARRDRTGRALVLVVNNQHLIKGKDDFLFLFRVPLNATLFFLIETGFVKYDFVRKLYLPPLDFPASV